MMSRVSTALLIAVAFSGAAQAAPAVTSRSLCDSELANVAAMRKTAAVGPKAKAEIDGLLQTGAEACAAGDFAAADRTFAILRGMMPDE